MPPSGASRRDREPHRRRHPAVVALPPVAALGHGLQPSIPWRGSS